MWEKTKEKPKEQRGKEKLFKNPIKSMETALISAGCSLEGSIEAEGTLIVEGSVRGTIKCTSLEILENGRADAKVEGENLTRIFHESLAATTDITALPGVLGCRPLRRTV